MRSLNATDKSMPVRWTCIDRISAALSDKLQTSAALHFNTTKGYYHLVIISHYPHENTYRFYPGTTCQTLQKTVRSTHKRADFCNVVE